MRLQEGDAIVWGELEFWVKKGVLSPGHLEHSPISFVFRFLACRVEAAVSMGIFEQLQVRHGSGCPSSQYLRSRGRKNSRSVRTTQ